MDILAIRPSRSFAMIDGQAEALMGLAALHRHIGDPASARTLIGRALELNAQIESPIQAADGWLEQAAVHDCLGEPTAARQARERAISYLGQPTRNADPADVADERKVDVNQRSAQPAVPARQIFDLEASGCRARGGRGVRCRLPRRRPKPS
jgi:hypothetical protein